MGNGPFLLPSGFRLSKWGEGHVSPIGSQTNDRMCIGLRQKEMCIGHQSYHEFMTTLISGGKDTGGPGLVLQRLTE